MVGRRGAKVVQPIHRGARAGHGFQIAATPYVNWAGLHVGRSPVASTVCLNKAVVGMWVAVVRVRGTVLLLGRAALHWDVGVGSRHGVRHPLVGFTKGWWGRDIIASTPSHGVHGVEIACRGLHGQGWGTSW